MRRYAWILIVVVLTASALGQSAQRFDLFGGYSYLHSDPGNGIASANASGWAASLNWNWNHWLGLKADLSGHYCCDSQNEHNFLFGPQLTFHSRGAKFFVHGLGGVSRGSANGFSDSVTAWAFGGGVDWALPGHSGLALRLGQIDYLGTNYGDQTQNNFRYSTGLVLSFGGNK